MTMTEPTSEPITLALPDAAELAQLTEEVVRAGCDLEGLRLRCWSALTTADKAVNRAVDALMARGDGTQGEDELHDGLSMASGMNDLFLTLTAFAQTMDPDQWLLDAAKSSEND